MTQLRRDQEEFRKRNVEVIVIGPEDPKTFNYHWERFGMPFIGIPDPDHKIADLFGQQVKVIKFGRLPAMILIDKKGIIRFCHYGNSSQDIVSNTEIFRLIDELILEESGKLENSPES